MFFMYILIWGVSKLPPPGVLSARICDGPGNPAKGVRGRLYVGFAGQSGMEAGALNADCQKVQS